ncbi:MAG: NAD(P)-dependent oxidoreductase, partial [Haloferacaceae archaeon]|nr:NAD(P)-dependent oxidoreductase [Haloferacaceae archaeon]
APPIALSSTDRIAVVAAATVDALVEALRSATIGGAALDVTDPEPLPASHPLWGLENVLITPHTAGTTPHYWERLADIVETNLRRLKTGSALQNRVA